MGAYAIGVGPAAGAWIVGLIDAVAAVVTQRGLTKADDGVTVFSSIKAWARNIKRDVVALWIAARDPRVPWYAKAVAGAVAAYALSPIDLIPDFVPLFGYLDDVIIVPLGIMLAVRLVPGPLMEEFRQKAIQREGRPKSHWGIAAIVAIWLATAAWLIWLLWPFAKTLTSS